MKKQVKTFQSEFIFPNLLNNRNLVALPDRVWVMDLTEIPTNLTNDTKIIIKLFFIIDLATKKVVTHKLFKAKGHGAIRARYIAREVDQKLRQLQQRGAKQLILHSDRGPEFTCSVYHEMLRKYKFCEGSMSQAYQPTHNGVAERFARTIKHQLHKTNAPPIPKQANSLQELEKIIDKRINAYNSQHQHRSSYKQTPVIIDQALNAHEAMAPPIVAHWPQPIQPETKDQISTLIHEFRQDAIARLQNRHPVQVLLDTEEQVRNVNRGIERIKDQLLETKTEIYDTQQILLQRIDELEQRLSISKNKPTKRIEMPLRDPAGSPIYDYLINLPKPHKTPTRIWARNKIAITLLRYLGVRASELLTLTRKHLEDAMQKGTIQLLQPKTKARRIIVLTDATNKQLNKLKKDIVHAFPDPDTPLGASISKTGSRKTDGLMYSQNWISSLNTFIKRVNDKFPGVYTSHSFRINVVTRLLRTVPIVEVKNIIGHKDIKTTERYYRYQPKAHQIKATIDHAIEGDRNE